MAFDKRGQEGLTLTTLLLIVLGIVVVVVVIIGFTNGFDFIFGKIETLPGQSLQAAVTACELAADNDLRADYCSQMRKVDINGKEQYATCAYLKSANYLTAEPKDGCGTMATVDRVSFCEAQDLDDDDLVNGEACPPKNA